MRPEPSGRSGDQQEPSVDLAVEPDDVASLDAELREARGEPVHFLDDVPPFTPPPCASALFKQRRNVRSARRPFQKRAQEGDVAPRAVYASLST